MNVDVTMPQLGETVAEGTVTRWLRQVGDTVADQEPLVEISTDKVDTEVPSPAAGTLIEILVREDSTVAVGTVIAVLGSPTTSPVTVPGPRHRHSPRVRRLASQAGVRLDTVVGSGPSGRVTPRDVLALVPGTTTAAQLATPVAENTRPGPTATAAPTRGPVPTPITVEDGDQTRPMTRLRSLVAERMMTSLQTSAQLTSVMEVDLTAVVALRERTKGDLAERLGIRLTITAFFAKTVVEALRAHPLLNSSIHADGRTVVQHASQHLGVAVDTPKGLMVPVARGAGDLTLLALCRRINDLAAGARSGSLTADQLSGGTFTLTNTGSRGVLWDTPILVPGQVGILGSGTVVERPAVVRLAGGGRGIAIRSITNLALTYDHRLVDGADAARFLGTIKDRLEAGQFQDDLV
jgi:pyruvate dehydrogenase E2 component (dihydrolipoamide acetyltransferase)